MNLLFYLFTDLQSLSKLNLNEPAFLPFYRFTKASSVPSRKSFFRFYAFTTTSPTLRQSPTHKSKMSIEPEELKLKPGRPKKDDAPQPVALDLEIAEPKLYHGDCFEVMKNLADGSVDLVLNDPPYGCTTNEWDSSGYSLEKCWEHYERLLKPDGIVVLFACSDATGDPFLEKVLRSRPKGWKYYTLVFEKYNHSSPTLAMYRPLRWHEDIVVFYRGSHFYDPQKWIQKGNKNKNIGLTGEKEREPKSILPVYPMEKQKIHTTQKPVKTMEWLVKTYCPIGGVVLDNTMGSGSTGVACVNTYRAFIGIEMDDEYFPKCHRRIIMAMRKQLHEELEVEPEKTITADEVPLPVDIMTGKQFPEFDAKEFIKFYEGLKLDCMEYKEVCEVVVRYLNQYFAVINGKDLAYVEWKWHIRNQVESWSPFTRTVLGENDHRYDYVVRNSTEMKRRLMKCRMLNEEGKKMDVFDMWCRHVSTKEYTDMVFDPTEDVDPETTLNTFVGLKVQNELRQEEEVSLQNYDGEVIQPILDHLKALAGDDEVCYEYLLDWLAFPLQSGEKTNVALLIRGKPGCGKGIIFEKLMCHLIYGQKLAVQLGGGKQIGNKFNAHWKNKMLVVIDEPNKLNRDQRDNLKNMITSDVTVIEDKGVSAKFETDYTSYAFTCNHVPPEFLDHDDRRFFILQHNGKHVQDKEYFEKLISTIDQHYVEFYKFLMVRDIETYCKGDAPPKTFIKERLMLESVDPIFRYMRYLAEETDFPLRVKFLDFYKNAVKWCKEQQMPVTWAKQGQLALKKVIHEKISEQDLETSKSAQGFPGCEGKSQRCIIFPPKDEFIQLLIDNQVYTRAEELEAEIKEEQDIMMEDLPDYDELLCQEQERELERMKQDLEGMELGQDRFDNE